MSSIFNALKKVYELFGGTITAKGHNVTRLSLWHTLPMHLIPLSLFQLLCWWTQCEMLLVRWGFWLESIPFIISLFYRTRVRSLVMLVTHSLHWLTHSCLVNLIDVTLACEDANSNLLRLLLLLMLWSWILVEILKLGFGQDLNLSWVEILMFGWDFHLMLSWDSEDEMWSRFVFELVIWP